MGVKGNHGACSSRDDPPARLKNAWLAPSARYLQGGARCDSHVGGGGQGDPIHGSPPQIGVPSAPNCRAAPLYMDKASLCGARAR